MTGTRALVKAVVNSLGLYPALSSVLSLSQKQSWRNGTGRTGRARAFAYTLAHTRPIVCRADASGSAAFSAISRKARISVPAEGPFLYCPDFFLMPIGLRSKARRRIGNLVPDYAEVLRRGVSGIREDVECELRDDSLSVGEKAFLHSLLDVCDGIRLYQSRCCWVLEREAGRKSAGHLTHEVLDTLQHVPDKPARTLREALQSYLIVNSLLWTSGYRLIGLGRLDQTLFPYYEHDVQTGALNVDKAFLLIKAFVRTIHEGYHFKSDVLPGDTGQAIVLGGVRPDGSDAGNDLTNLFLDAIRELTFPDPKPVFRVHSGTPEKQLTKAIELAKAGLPLLLTNDAVVTAALERFGYSRDDAFDYGVSACWEPLIPGRSLDQNNLSTINFLEAMEKTLGSDPDRAENTTEFTSFMNSYLRHLRAHVRRIAEDLSTVRFEPAPLLSLLTRHCVKRHKDIADGGADYNHFGLLSVALGNAVNALLNIRRLIYDESRMPLDTLKGALKRNFSDDEALLADLRSSGPKFGRDDPESINMCNVLIGTVFEALSDFRNFLGGKVKFGLSSPGYVTLGSCFSATADGRRAAEPFGAHIAPLPRSPQTSYTALGNFASSLDYQQAFNGAVTDLVIDQGTLHSHLSAFRAFAKAFVAQGGMQLQVSALDCAALIEARRNPAACSTLIVRVWGFSAYFKDLPPEYQDYLVEKAQRLAVSYY